MYNYSEGKSGAIEPIFKTPIYYNWMSDATIAQSLKEMVDDVEFIDSNEDLGHFSVSSNTFFSNILETYKLENVSYALDLHIRRYCDLLDFKFKSYNMVSWFIKMNKGDYVHYHTHIPTEMSGVYYFGTNAGGNDAKIVFECPHPMLDMSKVYQCVSPRWEHYAEPNKILLFPSWLRHGVKTQTSDKTRLALSFNLTFDV
jgi:uncharacterized protein (TIGR02466 family)